MMDNKRQLQISELIKRNFGPVLQQQGIYMYGDAFVTVTAVRITPDLSQAKIYVSIFNTPDKEKVLQKLVNHTHLLKQELASRIKHQVRRIPQIAFFMDETIDEMYRVDELFDKIKTIYPVDTISKEEE